MSQVEMVRSLLEGGSEMTIAEITEATGILRPNVRRILGEGAKEGKFQRVARGAYTLRQEGRQVLWIECGDCRDILKDMADGGYQYDMIFLDPAYYSPQLIGRNRLKQGDWYNFIMPREFYRVMESLARLVQNDSTHVYLMLSGAKSAQPDMRPYLEAAVLNGFKIASEGSYLKTTQDGRPVLNIRGVPSAAERIFLLNKTGAVNSLSLDFSFPRPKGYHTEKPEGMLERMILQSSQQGDHLLDPFAGSGKFGTVGLRLKRRVTLIEKSMDAITNHILPNLNVQKTL